MIKGLAVGFFCAVLLSGCVLAAESRFDDSMDDVVRLMIEDAESDAFCDAVYLAVDRYLLMRRQGGMSRKYDPSLTLNHLSDGLDDCQRRGYEPEPLPSDL